MKGRSKTSQESNLDIQNSNLDSKITNRANNNSRGYYSFHVADYTRKQTNKHLSVKRYELSFLFTWQDFLKSWCFLHFIKNLTEFSFQMLNENHQTSSTILHNLKASIIEMWFKSEFKAIIVCFFLYVSFKHRNKFSTDRL